MYGSKVDVGHIPVFSRFRQGGYSPCVLYNNYYTIAVQLHCTDAPLCTV